MQLWRLWSLGFQQLHPHLKRIALARTRHETKPVLLTVHYEPGFSPKTQNVDPYDVASKC